MIGVRCSGLNESSGAIWRETNVRAKRGLMSTSHWEALAFARGRVKTDFVRIRWGEATLIWVIYMTRLHGDRGIVNIPKIFLSSILRTAHMWVTWPRDWDLFLGQTAGCRSNCRGISRFYAVFLSRRPIALSPASSIWVAYDSCVWFAYDSKFIISASVRCRNLATCSPRDF